MFSFAVTAYNEMSQFGKQGQRLLECISAAQDCEEISEIVIVDDFSGEFLALSDLLQDQPKVRLYQNLENFGVFGNKLEAIAKCTGDWVITCDSDNRMGQEYLEHIDELAWRPDTWYCPSLASPNFDYRHLIGLYDLKTLDSVFHKSLFGCCLNTGNQTVHRNSFLSVFDKYRGPRSDLKLPNFLDLSESQRLSQHSKDVFNANDSFIFNMLWLEAGNSLRICPGLEYAHHYTSGKDSNYARAPKEKSVLNSVLMRRLKASMELR